MGIGPGVLSLYAALRRDDVLKPGMKVMELGSQVLVCHGEQQSVLNVLQAFGQQPSADEVKKLAEGSPAAPLYERLGMPFACIDASGEYGGLKWDLNFDTCPPEHKRRYDFVTNHGTTEHLLNQYNAFQIVHDLTARGGLMMHALPFLSYVDHGYFCYQPNLFVDLARANGYDLLGMWINVDPKMNHLIPWQHGLEKHLRSDTSDSLLLVLFRKTTERDFSMPFQTVYGGLVPKEVLQRYEYVVDGETVSGKRGLYLSLEDTLLRYYELKSSSPGSEPDRFFLKKVSGWALVDEIKRRALRRLPKFLRRGS